MIGKLKGLIDSIGDDHLIIDVHGVGYSVFASQRLLLACEVGTAMELMIETHVREDHIHLYGFASPAEREGFKLLTTVQGVGAKMALAMLGHYNIAQLQNIIAAQDKTQLTAISGVGPKLAERLITELKNKVSQLSAAPAMAQSPPQAVSASKGKKPKAAAPTNAPVAMPQGAGDAEDAVSALVNLGYGRAEAFCAVAKAQNEGEAGLDALIKAGLSELAG